MKGKKRTPWLKKPGVQTLLASLLCILLGLIIGYVVLLIIRPEGAVEGIQRIMKNFMNSTRENIRIKNLGNTLTKTAPLLMCSLSVLFAYKVGMFNIGAAGQYVAGAGAALYCALALKMPWYVCVMAALVAGALLGMASGALKAFFNVNEVISCIMLNWIMLYCVNMLLTPLAPAGMPDTESLAKVNPAACLPTLGFEKLFPDNSGRVTIAIPLAILIAVLVWVVLNKTKIGYELRATGSNKHAAKYAGMRERTNLILTMAISGALAGVGAAMYYLTDYQQWAVTQSAVPAMGFNGIAAAFLGGLNPIGTIFSSYLIEHITSGGGFLNNKIYSAEISELITAVIIYLCGFVLFFRGGMTRLVEDFKRKDARRNFFSGLVVAVLVLTVMFQFGVTSAKQAEIDELNVTVEKKEALRKAASDERKELQGEVKELQKQLNQANKELKAAQEALEAAQMQLEALMPVETAEEIIPEETVQAGGTENESSEEGTEK